MPTSDFIKVPFLFTRASIAVVISAIDDRLDILTARDDDSAVTERARLTGFREALLDSLALAE